MGSKGGFNPERLAFALKHGTSIALMRKAIESQLVLLNEGQLRRLLMALNQEIADGIETEPPPTGERMRGIETSRKGIEDIF